MTTKATQYASPALCLVLLMGCSLAAQGAAPLGWLLAGGNPTGYETGVDPQLENNGHPSAYLKSKTADVTGFGTLMQSFSATKYLGKRIRLSAFVKSEGVQDWAALWMRVDKGSEPLEFDNMKDRPIKGTTGWQSYQVVLDVPSDATGIYFGVLLGGRGKVWLNSVNIEVVGTDTATTGKRGELLHDEPVNLDFEKQ